MSLRIAACLCAFLAVAVAPIRAYAEAPTRVSNPETVKLLADLEILADHRELPLAIRVLKLRQDGECLCGSSTCPQEVVYLTVSEFGEHPERSAYRLPEARTWQFLRWTKGESPEDLAVLELMMTDNACPAAEKVCEVWVNRTSIRMECGN